MPGCVKRPSRAEPRSLPTGHARRRAWRRQASERPLCSQGLEGQFVSGRAVHSSNLDSDTRTHSSSRNVVVICSGRTFAHGLDGARHRVVDVRAVGHVRRAVSPLTRRTCAGVLCQSDSHRRWRAATLFSRPQPPITPVSRWSFSRFPPSMRCIHLYYNSTRGRKPGMCSIHPYKCHLYGWIECIPGGTRENDGLETGAIGGCGRERVCSAGASEPGYLLARIVWGCTMCEFLA